MNEKNEKEKKERKKKERITQKRRGEMQSKL